MQVIFVVLGIVFIAILLSGVANTVGPPMRCKMLQKASERRAKKKKIHQQFWVILTCYGSFEETVAQMRQFITKADAPHLLHFLVVQYQSAKKGTIQEAIKRDTLVLEWMNRHPSAFNTTPIMHLADLWYTWSRTWMMMSREDILEANPLILFASPLIRPLPNWDTDARYQHNLATAEHERPILSCGIPRSGWGGQKPTFPVIRDTQHDSGAVTYTVRWMHTAANPLVPMRLKMASPVWLLHDMKTWAFGFFPLPWSSDVPYFMNVRLGPSFQDMFRLLHPLAADQIGLFAPTTMFLNAEPSTNLDIFNERIKSEQQLLKINQKDLADVIRDVEKIRQMPQDIHLLAQFGIGKDGRCAKHAIMGTSTRDDESMINIMYGSEDKYETQWQEVQDAGTGSHE